LYDSSGNVYHFYPGVFTIPYHFSDEAYNIHCESNWIETCGED